MSIEGPTGIQPGQPSGGFLETLFSRIVSALMDEGRNNPFLFFKSTQTTRFETPPVDSAYATALVAGEVVRRPLFGDGEEPVSSPEAAPPDGLKATRPPRPADPLMRKLRAIKQRATELQEERGLQTLYAAIGMISWKADDGGRPFRAPITLLPVTIVSDPRVRGDLAVRRADDSEPSSIAH